MTGTDFVHMTELSISLRTSNSASLNRQKRGKHIQVSLFFCVPSLCFASDSSIGGHCCLEIKIKNVHVLRTHVRIYMFVKLCTLIAGGSHNWKLAGLSLYNNLIYGSLLFGLNRHESEINSNVWFYFFFNWTLQKIIYIGVPVDSKKKLTSMFRDNRYGRILEVSF